MGTKKTSSILLLRICAFCRDRRGSSAIFLTLLMSSMIGVVGLGVESGLWFTERRGLQTQADAAAIAGAYQIIAAASNATIVSTAKAEAANNGFVSNAVNTIAINTPPTSGPLSGNAGAVEAILATPKSSILSGLVLPGGVTVRARAVAQVITIGQPCVLALDPNNDIGISFQGNPTVTMPKCIMAANATSAQAIKLQGNPTLTAQNVYTSGGLSQAGNANFISAGLLPMVGQPPIADPYASLPISVPGSCPGGLTVPGKPGGTLSPGLYCGGMSFAANATYTLNSGIYYLYNGGFTIGANTTVKVQSGGGLTIILTGSPASKIGSISIGGGATVTLAPSTSGTYKGVLFYQDRNAPANGSNSMTGGSSMAVSGLIYTPSQPLTFNGNSASSCLNVVAYQITFKGTSSLDNSGCPALGVTPILVKGVTLEE